MKKAYLNIYADHAAVIDAVTYAYIASDGTQDIGLRKLCLLDTVPLSLNVHVKGNALYNS